MSRIHSKISILVIEQDATVRYLRALALRLEGYTVATAEHLADARQKLAEKQFNLVILDVGHFAEPGLAFCEEVKDNYPHTKLLMQGEDRIFPIKSSCPDTTVPKQEGPLQLVREVQRLLQSA
ncbi:MAG TPA: response regulator [Candidatus Limnocylindrales bacterium]|jgi:DNA-binding NtrC family response regulator|nr:response regulator [Candidatus Limnocylindrales bacterium]